ncbi:hypothetical protein L9F63_023533, partial [Diploptera punctata]
HIKRRLNDLIQLSETNRNRQDMRVNNCSYRHVIQYGAMRNVSSLQVNTCFLRRLHLPFHSFTLNTCSRPVRCENLRQCMDAHN